MGDRNDRIDAEIRTVRGALQGVQQDLETMLTALAPSKRSARFNHYLAQLEQRIEGALLCADDARSILAEGSEPPQRRGG